MNASTCKHPGGGIGIASDLNGCLECEAERLRAEVGVCREQFDRVVARHIQGKRELRARAEKAEAEVQRLIQWIDGYPCACDRPPLAPRSTSARPETPSSPSGAKP